MKAAQAWRLGMGDMQILPGSRHRPPMKRPMWIIVLVSMVSVFLICAYVYPAHSGAACYIFSPRGCKAIISDWLPPAPMREYTDEEIAAHVVIKEILNAPPMQSENPKIAFMFLTPHSLPFEKLWDKFFHVRFCYLNPLPFPFFFRFTVAPSLFLSRLFRVDNMVD